MLHEMLSHLEKGTVTLRDPDGYEHAFGKTGTGPDAYVHIDRWEFYPRLLRDRSLGLGESYMDGWWSAEDGDLVSFIGTLLLNDIERTVRHSPALLLRMARLHLSRRPSSQRRSADNVHAHYDLGNDFFALMLDPSMAYSCGFLDGVSAADAPANTLEAMQERKHDLVCRKLDLKEGQRLLDVGCGWGGLLFHAAKHYGVHAHGVTLSAEQEAWIKRRVREEGLDDRITVERKDYRAIDGTFDAFASIGMFEHVGDRWYGTFMRTIASVLIDGGRGLLHTIGWGQENRSIGSNPWITKYIFPGGHLPSLDRIVAELQRAGCTVGHMENFKLHYAETLRKWKANVADNIDRIRALPNGYDERFLRMWDFYLQSCEAAFRYGKLQLYQVLFQKGWEWTLPSRFRYS